MIYGILVCKATSSVVHESSQLNQVLLAILKIPSRISGFYPRPDLRRATPSLLIPFADNLLCAIIFCLSGFKDILCTFLRCGPKLSDRIRFLMRHSGRGHLRPAFLLCLGDSLRCRCKLDFASCGLPLKVLPHARQCTPENVVVLESGEVGEMEA